MSDWQRIAVLQPYRSTRCPAHPIITSQTFWLRSVDENPGVSANPIFGISGEPQPARTIITANPEMFSSCKTS